MFKSIVVLSLSMIYISNGLDGCSNNNGPDHELVKDKVYACGGTFSGGLNGLEAESLCGVGFSVCESAKRMFELGLTKSICESLLPNDEVYWSKESSNGYWQCNSDYGTSGNNDVWGCRGAGSTFKIAGCNTDTNCGKSTNIACWQGSYPYFNFGNDGNNELNNAKVTDGHHSGVLCCENPSPLHPIYRYYAGGYVGDHFYTKNYNELGNGNVHYKYEGIGFKLLSNKISGSKALHRYYQGTNYNHFYTTNVNEIGTITPGTIGNHGYKYESIIGYCYDKQVSGSVPLYRHFHKSIVDHFYTINKVESDKAVGDGWGYEGIQCYVLPPN